MRTKKTQVTVPDMPKAPPIDQRVVDALADGALDGVKHLRAFLDYEGNDPRFYQKAKSGGVLVGSYVKAIATQTNRMAVEVAVWKMTELPA